MPNRTLSSLLNHVDDWFKDLTLDPAIGQFQLEDNDRDRAKLALINRTTNNWFKTFNSIGLITNDGLSHEDLGLEEEENGDKKVEIVDLSDHRSQIVKNVKRTRATAKLVKAPRSNKATKEAEESHLDSLVQDLEQLLDERVEEELKYVLHQIYPSDHIALRCDSTIGHCLTISMQPTDYAQQLQSKKRTSRAPNQQSYTTVTMATRARTSATRLNRLNTTPAVPTPAPTKDHDYIVVPQSLGPQMTPAVTIRDKLQQSIMSKADRRAIRAKRNTLAVLNTGAIKRFARFSDKFRILSEKQESIRVEV